MPPSGIALDLIRGLITMQSLLSFIPNFPPDTAFEIVMEKNPTFRYDLDFPFVMNLSIELLPRLVLENLILLPLHLLTDCHSKLSLALIFRKFLLLLLVLFH